MKDLTLLYYTANTIEDKVPGGPIAENVRKRLLALTKGKIPIVSVSQKPINFGHNICVGEIGRSLYNCYKQILTGAKAVKTKYVACCEDDSLYSLEHFRHRPSKDDTFSYNTNMWYAEDKYFWKKGENYDDHGMLGCICTTKLLVDTLEPRFTLFPQEPKPATLANQRFWQEPGRFDRKFGVHHVKTETFKTKAPIIVLNYSGSMCGKRGPGRHVPVKLEEMAPFGNARKLWFDLWLPK